MKNELIIETREFGVLKVKPEDIITFVLPIIGFEESLRFVLVEDKDFFPIQWLQSVDESGLLFPIVNPGYFKVQHDLNAASFNLADIKLENPDDALVYTLLVIPSDNFEDARTNLRAPIIVNAREKLAKQVVYDDDKYPVQFFLFKKNEQKKSKDSAGS